ncbi:hypothetical protein PAXINDRAFT_7929 [Paxillus involutus ATCC 200175]|nr:hypothetical protein PAXINDRAFT_7929 [Paxillus involutus ATCC 200175]
MDNAPSMVSVGSSHSIAGLGSGTNGGRYLNTDLPPDFLKDKKWQKVIISTLSLWAANLPDTFNILKNQITDALKFILPVAYPEYPNIVQTLKLDASSPIVAVGSPLSHFIGLLLDHLVFLYEDLNRDDPANLFRSQLIVQLLSTTHLSAIKGFIHVPQLNTHTLVQSGVTRMLGLCGAALECALCLIHTSVIEAMVN